MTKAEKYLAIFSQWKSAQTDEDYRKIATRGQLNRKSVAAQCGFCKSVLVQNPSVRAALTELENNLKARGLLDYRSSSDSKSAGKSGSNYQQFADIDSLQKRLTEAESALQMFEKLEKLMIETGRLPR
jgi:hypothetical protein